MSARDRFNVLLNKAKVTAVDAGAQAGTLLKAGQAQINHQVQSRAVPASTSATSIPDNAERRLPSVSDAMMQLDSKLVFSLPAECDKAAKILAGFMHPHSPDTDVGSRMLNVIPNAVVKKAKGFAVFTVLKAGFLFSGRIGSGLVISRLPDGSWSAPSVLAIGGVGYGLQIGADITEVVVVLNTVAAVKAFSQGGNVTLGGNISASAGPVGTGAQVNAALRNTSPMFSYTRSKGLFAGVSIEGTVLIERREANKAFYGSAISAADILSGLVPSPERANAMYEVIEQAEGLLGTLPLQTPDDDTESEMMVNQHTAPLAAPSLAS